MKFNKHIESIKVYEGGKPIELVVREFGIKPEDVVKLASNENPNGCSLKVQDAIKNIVGNMAMYPDDSMMKLKAGLSSRFDVKDENIIIGAGSDQVIELAIYAKTNKDSKILTNGVTFAMYDVYAKHVGCEIVKTTSTDTHDLKQFYELYKEHNPEIIFLCTPNNPTGDAMDAKEMLEFIDKIDSETLVVVDGAYMEYAKAKDSAKAVEPKDLVDKYDNVLYLGTFSKAYGLGGMRVGYGISNVNIINQLYKLRPPFNITTLSLEAASVALEDEEFVQKSISMNFQEMKRYEDFATSEKIDIITSYTNFVTLVLNKEQNSTQISESLLRLGMIVRDLSGYGMNAIRVTVGKPEQNSRFFELVTKFL